MTSAASAAVAGKLLLATKSRALDSRPCLGLGRQKRSTMIASRVTPSDSSPASTVLQNLYITQFLNLVYRQVVIV